MKCEYLKIVWRCSGVSLFVCEYAIFHPFPPPTHTQVQREKTNSKHTTPFPDDTEAAPNKPEAESKKIYLTRSV